MNPPPPVDDDEHRWSRMDVFYGAMPDSDELEWRCEQQDGVCFCGFHPERKREQA